MRSETIRADRICPHCGADTLFYRIRISSDEAYEDVQYNCTTCNKLWWVEGADA